MTARRLLEDGTRDVARLVVAVVAVALSAQVSVTLPGTPVPQSLQTLAVVVVGAWLGPRDGALAMALYIVVGALGPPVFADGAGGPGHLVGPTVGYLVGFVAGAALMGWWVRRPWAGPGWARAVLTSFAGAVLAHGVILVMGWIRLGALVGLVEAFETGVEPFLLGGVAKSVAAALVWVAIKSRMEPVHRPLVG